MAVITVSNQQPGTLSSFHLGSLAGTFDPFAMVRDEVIRPLLSPLIQGTPVSVTMDGKSIGEDDITSLLFDCCGDTINQKAEDDMKEILSQTLTYYDKSLTVQDTYSVQAAKKLNMLLPSPRVMYTPDDIISTAKQLLAGQVRPEEFFATLAFYSRVQSFGYYFANDAAFAAFKDFFAAEVQQIQPLLTQETSDLCTSFMATRLTKLTEGFVIRDDETQNNDPYTFARLLPFMLMKYEQQCRTNNMPQHMAGHMPFSVSESVVPKTIILVNVEKHAHAHPNEIKQEWDIIKASMQMKPKVLGTNQIAKLTAVARMSAKMRGQAMQSQQAGAMRSAIIRFRKTAPTSVDLFAYVKKIYKHTQFVQQSENAVKCVRMTYQKPSRRDPDNPDRQGKSSGIIYRPDLHVYLDCSGSISEREYQDAIKAIIKLAKKMNVNLYFNSFSHIMSSCTKLPMKGKTLHEIYDIFKNIPKVGGGTEYEQIWHYINRSRKLRTEVSIVISDFEWTAPNRHVEHPRFLYYAPISTTNWKHLTDDAKKFAKSMMGICPDIRKKMLM